MVLNLLLVCEKVHGGGILHIGVSYRILVFFEMHDRENSIIDIQQQNFLVPSKLG
jgi:hypothetical protein